MNKELIKEISKRLKNDLDDNKKVEEEPRDWYQYGKGLNMDSLPYCLKAYERTFNAGKARGKWEATQWKYEMPDDYNGFKYLNQEDVNTVRHFWELARELKGGSNGD